MATKSMSPVELVALIMQHTGVEPNSYLLAKIALELQRIADMIESEQKKKDKA